MLEDLKHNKKNTRRFLWRLRSLVDDNATACTNTIGQSSTASAPPTDVQIVTESCDWCLMESPWTTGDEGFDPDDDIIDNTPPQENSPQLAVTPKHKRSFSTGTGIEEARPAVKA